MTYESRVALLQAYKDAIEANEDSIAELLKTVILEAMKDERTPSIVIDRPQDTIKPPWTVTCGPDTVKLGTNVACTSIDHMREVTS